MTSSMKLNSLPKEDMIVREARIHRAAMGPREDEVVLLEESVSQVCIYPHLRRTYPLCSTLYSPVIS